MTITTTTPQRISQLDQAAAMTQPPATTDSRLLDSVRSLYPTDQQEAFLSLQAQIESLLAEIQSHPKHS